MSRARARSSSSWSTAVPASSIPPACSPRGARRSTRHACRRRPPVRCARRTGADALILFVHGWGYDASFWDPLRKQLRDFPSAALDLGYFGAANLAIPSGTRLLVGHSLGYLWLARQERLRDLPLIGVNAFPRFLQAK